MVTTLAPRSQHPISVELSSPKLSRRSSRRWAWWRHGVTPTRGGSSAATLGRSRRWRSCWARSRTPRSCCRRPSWRTRKWPSPAATFVSCLSINADETTKHCTMTLFIMTSVKMTPCTWYFIMVLGRMTFFRMTLVRMTLVRMTLVRMTLVRMTLVRMTLVWITLNILALARMVLNRSVLNIMSAVVNLPLNSWSWSSFYECRSEKRWLWSMFSY